MVENLDCVTSKPCDDVYEETHPDWAPTIFKFKNHSATNVSRYNRVKKRLAVNEKPIETGIKHDLFMQNFSSEATELSISDINMADIVADCKNPQEERVSKFGRPVRRPTAARGAAEQSLLGGRYRQ
ncbi:hypothetical protein OUZ56_011433 [Daphnia magna]|uniref:Uncharacterized protein n=1 Tax=Daphnia magna TaxID=35525 RepID=A0ABQ9Z0C8_9CRUS|nr:hypothetical protein OUZ56_011433 [Daphnia magna]